MDLIADILLILSACAAAAYCVVLSKRLRRFTNLEKGVGGAITALSSQVDGMTKTLENAQISAVASAQSLDNLTTRAESAARRLELLVASLHDIPEPKVAKKESTPKDPEPFFLSKRTQFSEAAE